jgi:Histidine kinase-, DNA gyrase B-, and HSP90-like ATPase
MSVSTHYIKAKSHILKLLGDELIGSDSLAIFELVKNAYDADAENVYVLFENLNSKNQRIIIEDDGHGMTPKIIQDVWLTIGTDFKRGENRKVSKKFKRVSLGNKGVGRLAVHKLAKEIVLETQTLGELFTSRLVINWENLINSKEYIEDLTVEIESVANTLFKKGQGTRIILSNLVTAKWTKPILRELARKVENIKNPFAKFANFNISITSNSNQDWLENIKTSTEILDEALFQFDFEINNWKPDDSSLINENELAEFLWSYKFNPHSLMKIDGIPLNVNSIDKKKHQNNYEKHKENNIFSIGNELDKIDENDRNKYLLNSDLTNIGSIKGKFFVFNLSNQIVSLFFGGQKEAIKNYLKENCGVRIFRDDIRVYNYGEKLDDWLDLDLTKIQRVGDHFAKKVTVGAIELSLKDSEIGLTEKTNREGFNENYFFNKLKIIVSSAFDFFEKKASEDKENVDEFIDKLKPIKNVGLSETIIELVLKLKEKKLDKELEPLIKRVEKDYNEMRDVMVSSGITGLNLGIIFHEVDREMKFLSVDLDSKNIDISKIKGRVKNLIQVIEKFTPILKQNNKVKIKASDLIQRAKDINENRFNYHKLIFSSPLLSKENPDFTITGASNLLISAISNLIDNSIYWVSSKRDIETEKFKGGVYIGTDVDSFGGNAIIIADNGVGFNIEEEELIRPFVTTKPGGMGLGLYYTNLVMETIGGKMLFKDSNDLDIPKVYNGACIVLVFPKSN